jgi:hypothetical protein
MVDYGGGVVVMEVVVVVMEVVEAFGYGGS